MLQLCATNVDSSTTSAHFVNGCNSQLVASLILWMLIVTTNPCCADTEARSMPIKHLPELAIQYGRLVCLAPSALFPAINPLIEALYAVVTIRCNDHIRAIRNSIKTTNNGSEFHAIVRGSKFSAALKALEGQVSTTKDEPPTTRAGVT